MKTGIARRPPRLPARSGGRGFVLIMVIGMLVVLVMLAAIAATTVARVREDQAAEDQRVRDIINVQSTRATLMYLMGTQRVTFAGMTVDDQVVMTAAERQMMADGDPAISNMPVGNEIRLDGTWYKGLGDGVFAMQDDRGRISINWSSPFVLQRWLQSLGVQPQDQDSLFAALLDYQDADDLYRLNGAEAQQYEQAGLDPPPNRPLITPGELRKVMGWSKALKSVSEAELYDVLSVSRNAQICINTAPESVLELLPGVTPAMAKRVVDLRNAQAIFDEASVSTLLPTLPAEADLVSLHPGVSGTLTVLPKQGAGGSLVHWTLTPFDDGGRPWRIDYELRLPARPRDGQPPAREAATPLLANAPAPHS